MWKSSQIMSQVWISSLGFVVLMILVTISYADENPKVSNLIWAPKSIKDSILTPVCSLTWIDHSFGAFGIIKGDETSLQKALSMVQKNAQGYVVVFFYASWCPFSVAFTPTLSLMASLYPSLAHYAIEESFIRTSIFSKYGVHGFPTLIVLNSTMRVRYHGSRTLDSLMDFYTNVTGIKAEFMDTTSFGETMHKFEKVNISDPESCPSSWPRSPENMLLHETFLTLATIFVVLRLLYISYPFIIPCARVFWRRRISNTRFKSLWERPLVYINRAVQLFSSLTEGRKRLNLHGAMNAKAKAAWASKSLASVSFGEASSTHES